MKVQLFIVFVLWTLIELPVLISSFAAPYETHQAQADSSVVIAYNRSTEIEKHCSSFLSSASELKPNENRGSNLKDELSFYLGDWKQENDEAPLMQLYDYYWRPESTTSLIKLVSFDVKDVNSVQKIKNAVSLGGVLSFGLSRDISFAYGVNLEPRMSPGSSIVKITFEGVYMETQENGGERLMCLVGSSTSTLPSTDCCDRGDPPEESSSHVLEDVNRGRIRFLEDDQILLVLRYPKTFKLTKRAIQGEMTSLHKQGDPSYCSIVYLSSQLISPSKYQFASELLHSRNFTDPHPYQDELLEDGVRTFPAREFCRLIYNISRDNSLDIIPNYRVSGSYMNQIHGKLGPFFLAKDNEATGGLGYDDIKLIFQPVKCEEDTSKRAGIAKVSVVVRAVPYESFPEFERFRTGLSGLTLTAEGIWNSSSGQLLMVGCQGKVDSGLEGCYYDIAMYFPRLVSILQRSFLFGSISSAKKDIGPDNPLFFSAISRTSSIASTSYNYLKIKLVNCFERRTLRYQILRIVNQFHFRYQALEEPPAKLMSRNLALQGDVIPDQLIDGQNSRVSIYIEVLALDIPLSGWSESNLDKGNRRQKPVIIKDDLTSCQLVNVSLRLVFRNEEFEPIIYKNFSELFLEGLYDPVLGESHLIGCRKALVESIGLERGQDCLLEVKIQYPVINLEWWKWKYPTAKITISSQRQEDDPLYFSLISLQAYLTTYQEYFEIVITRAFFKAILCILMLAGSIAIIWRQLLYMKVNADIVPHISTPMLAFQILGYSLLLICRTKVLFKSKDPEAYGELPHNHPAYGMLKLLESFKDVLVLVALILIGILFHMVAKSRSKPHSKGTSELRYAYNEKPVILTIMAICNFGFLVWCMDPPGNGDMWHAWMAGIEDFNYFVQDFFLLPQILSNLLKPTPVKSLTEAYYLGFTSIRLFVHFLDNAMDPISRSNAFEFVSRSSSSLMFAKVAATPITMIMAAIVVYIQQRKYQKPIYSPKQGDV